MYLLLAYLVVCRSRLRAVVVEMTSFRSVVFHSLQTAVGWRDAMDLRSASRKASFSESNSTCVSASFSETATGMDAKEGETYDSNDN